MDEVIVSAQNGNERAQLAIDVYVYNAKKYLGSYTFIMGGVDVVIFTGGIGDNAPLIREKICEGLEEQGIIIDKNKNDEHVNGEEGIISSEKSKVKIMCIPTNEELIIARKTARLAHSKTYTLDM